jgi:hypothetical protein
MATQVPPKKNAAFTLYVSLVSQANTKVMQSNPTLASGDVKVSTDGAALANLTTLPVVTPASSKAVKVDLSASEMNGDNIVLIFSDAAGAEWCDLVINLQTVARQIDDLAYPATSGRSMVVDAAGLVDANTVKVGPTGSGTAQTARDIGASVLLSSGTGTGQLDITSGVAKANLAQILGTALTETSGQIAAAFKKFFDKATPTGTINSIPDAVAGAAGGLFIAGSNAATTANITGNLTGNVSGSVGSVTGAVGSVATGGITTGSFAAGAIDAAAIAADAIGSSELAATAAAEIATQVRSELTTELGRIDATISSRATPAQVNTEVVDALAVDTYAEPGQGAPAATATLAVKINYLYKAWRNKKTQTGSTFSLFADDASTVDQKATVSDDGTTTTVGEIATGP